MKVYFSVNATTIYPSLTSSPSVRFKVEMLVAVQDAAADLLGGENWEVCNKGFVTNREPQSLVGLMDQETENFIPLVSLSVQSTVFAKLHDPLQTRPEKTFKIINNFYFWRKCGRKSSDGSNTAPSVRVAKYHATVAKTYRTILRTIHAWTRSKSTSRTS